MMYIGIDISKHAHEVGMINDQGEPVENLQFHNTKASSGKLLEYFNHYKLTPEFKKCKINVY